MSNGQTIALGYIGVHQIFQLALAAHEAGRLERLYCSALDAPGKWGRLFSKWSNAAALHPLGSVGLPSDKVTELPLPMLSRRLMRLLRPSGPPDYGPSNRWFDRSVSRRLPRSKAGLFVGTETCALESFREARSLGMKLLLDCPGIPRDFLAAEISMAADELGIRRSPAITSGHISDRIEAEIEAADLVLLCSEVQREHYRSKGIPADKLHLNPLWVDPAFFGRTLVNSRLPPVPLKALFVGAATLAKGAPYALDAAETLGDHVKLTFCGGIDQEVRGWAGDRLNRHECLSWQPRSALAKIYQAHHVLIFPTLGDSFGFVALEAMACGLPVIATTSAGAPLPDESWRVPPRNANALARRLELYVTNRDLLEKDSVLARSFALNFTPEKYRSRAARVFDFLSNGPGPI